MKTLFPLLALFLMAALSPAPINDAAHAPAPVPERSQAELAKEQGLNGAYGVVGKVPKKEGRSEETLGPATSGASAVAQASERVDASGSGTIAGATARVTREAHAFHFPAWLLALGAGVLAVGAVRGLKLWADKTLPTGPPARR